MLERKVNIIVKLRKFCILFIINAKFFSGQKLFKLTDKLTTLDRVVFCAAEFFGTAILVFLGCASCMVLGTHGLTHLEICLTFGLAVMLAIQVNGNCIKYGKRDIFQKFCNSKSKNNEITVK